MDTPYNVELTERAKELRRAYKREWNRRNADRVREYQNRYYLKKAEELAQQEQQMATGAGSNLP